MSLSWEHFGPRKPAVSVLRREVADLLLPRVVEDLRTNRHGVTSVVLVHLAGDPTDYVTDTLRHKIEESGFVDLLDAGVTERIQKKLNLRVTPVGERDAA